MRFSWDRYAIPTAVSRLWFCLSYKSRGVFVQFVVIKLILTLRLLQLWHVLFVMFQKLFNYCVCAYPDLTLENLSQPEREFMYM